MNLMVQIWQYLVNFSIFKMQFINFNVMASICYCIDYKCVKLLKKPFVITCKTKLASCLNTGVSLALDHWPMAT